MASITIRNVPEETHAELAARAALCGQSLQEYLKGKLIEMARHPDPRVLMARVRERNLASGIGVSTARILEERDADRR